MGLSLGFYMLLEGAIVATVNFAWLCGVLKIFNHDVMGSKFTAEMMLSEKSFSTPFSEKALTEQDMIFSRSGK